MGMLATYFQVIAIDTPGYGLSQPLKIEMTDVKDYALFFRKVFEKIHCKQFAIYGTATGAQIAIRYALEFPEQVDQLYLDNAAHFSHNEREEIFQHYFPDLSPTYDGDHLTKTWELVSRLFKAFPWFSEKPEDQLHNPELPIVVLDKIALDFLVAGDGYDKAYKCAFLHERAEHLQKLSVPFTVFRWENSILKKFVDRLITHEFPKNGRVVEINGNDHERLVQMTEEIHRTYQLPAKDTKRLGSESETEQGFAVTEYGTIHYCFRGDKSENPVLFLHEKYSSAAFTIEMAECIFPSVTKLSISLPSHGESDVADEEIEPKALASFLNDVVLSLGFSGYSVGGVYTPKLVHSLEKEGAYWDEAFRILPIGLEKKEPEQTGKYLLNTWEMIISKIENDVHEGQLKEKGLLTLTQLALCEWVKCNLN